MLSIAITWLILKITRKIGRGDQALVRLYHKTAHATGAFGAALEGHLILQYIYPHFYIVLYFVEHHTGISLAKFFYA